MVAVLVDLARGCAFGFGARRVASVQRVTGWLFYWRLARAASSRGISASVAGADGDSEAYPGRGRCRWSRRVHTSRCCPCPGRRAPDKWSIVRTGAVVDCIASTTTTNNMHDDCKYYRGERNGGEDDDAYCCGRARRDRSLCNLWTRNQGNK
jgi:predicted metal-binding protein